MRSRRIRLLAEMMRGNRLRYLGAVLAMATAAAISFVSPMVLRGVIDALTAASEGDWSAPVKLPGPLGAFFTTRGGVRYLVGHLWQMAVILLSIYLLSGLMQYLRGRLIAQSSERFAENLRNRLYTHLDSLPFNYHARAQTGDLIQRCTSDVETIRRFLAAQLVEIFRTLLMIVIALTVMLRMNARMTGVSMILVPPLFLFAYLFFSFVQKAFRISDEAEARMSAVLQENLSGVRVVRAFAREQPTKWKNLPRSTTACAAKNARLCDLLAHLLARFGQLSMLQSGVTLIFGVYLVNARRNVVGGNDRVRQLYFHAAVAHPPVGAHIVRPGQMHGFAEPLDEILCLKPETEDGDVFDAPLDRDIEFRMWAFLTTLPTRY